MWENMALKVLGVLGVLKVLGILGVLEILVLGVGWISDFRFRISDIRSAGFSTKTPAHTLQYLLQGSKMHWYTRYS